MCKIAPPGLEGTSTALSLSWSCVLPSAEFVRGGRRSSQWQIWTKNRPSSRLRTSPLQRCFGRVAESSITLSSAAEGRTRLRPARRQVRKRKRAIGLINDYSSSIVCEVNEGYRELACSVRMCSCAFQLERERKIEREEERTKRDSAQCAVCV